MEKTEKPENTGIEEEQQRGFMPEEEREIGEQKEIIRSGVGKVLRTRTESVETQQGQRQKAVLEMDVKGQLMNISKVKYINLRSKKPKTSGLWIMLDNEMKLVGNSALACMLRFYGLKKISEAKDKDLRLTSDEEGFLVVQAY